jgi:glycosyltransferase involved in cell wall biosynthesis
MNILHVVRGLANSSGTTHIVGPLAEAQARLGHDVSVYCVSKPGEEAVLPDDSLVESVEFPMTVRSRHYGLSLPFARELQNRIKQFHVVHIHAIWNFPTWWTMRCASRAGVPFIVAPQGSLEDWALGRSKRLKQLYARVFEKRLFDRASRIHAVTACEVRQSHRYGIQAPTMILPNGVDSTVVESDVEPANVRAELGLPQNELLVIFLGRVFPKKGLDLLIQALSDVTKSRRDVTLLIAGHDAGTGYLNDVKKLIRASGACDRFAF